MFKKITLIFVLILSFFIGNNVFAEPALPEDDISSTDFTIDTSSFSIGGNDLKVEGDSIATINNTLGNIIQKLMIALGVISLFVMTVGAGYMIMYHGQDEFLSKGKNIFIGGIISLIVALSSYYLVNLVGYILYK